MGDMKFQVNMFCGDQSYIFRTNSLKEVQKFTGEKKIDSESLEGYLIKLQTKMGPYKILSNGFTAPPKKDKAGPALPATSFKEQLVQKLKAKGKLDKKTEKKVSNMTEHQAQVGMFDLLSNGKPGRKK